LGASHPADGKVRYNYVPAPDIFGPGGYATGSLWRSIRTMRTEYGFGGTSAASAQAAGMIARVVEARRAAGAALDGSAVRQAMAARLGGALAPGTGYGHLTIAVV
jgi:hypothetical protein